MIKLNDFVDISTGLLLIAEIISPVTDDSFKVIAEFANGMHRDKVKTALTYKIIADQDAEVDLEYVSTAVEAILENLVMRAKYASNAVLEQKLRIEKNQREKERLERNKELFSQHAAGTTAEIASFLGVSKAKVRRFKADGVLDSMIRIAQVKEEMKELEN